LIEKSKEKKVNNISIELALLASRSNYSFRSVSGQPMEDFLKKVKVLSENEKIPSRQTISNQTKELYDDLKTEITEILQNEEAKSLAFTSDIWSAQYSHRRSYIDLNVNYISKSWELKTFLLKITHFPSAHTSQNIMNSNKGVLRDYGIEEENFKKFYVTTDCGANIKKAFRDMNFNQISCVAHGLHNLVSKDLMT
jgi:hypothetical protein